LVVPEESTRRLVSPPPLPARGYARLYHRKILQADRGCDFDFLRKYPAEWQPAACHCNAARSSPRSAKAKRAHRGPGFSRCEAGHRCAERGAVQRRHGSLIEPRQENDMTSDSPNRIMARRLALIPTGIENVYGIEPPPKGFDPLTADTAALLRYGFPLRPDPVAAPKAAAIWQRLLARNINMIKS
jgi:hypothetical protein